MELSVVVPTYGSAPALPDLVERTVAALDKLDIDYELIVVNDASPDEAWPILEQLGAKYPMLRAIELLTNHGQAQATMCGLAHARGELVATMDDDLQHPPEALPTLIAALREHPEWDAVVGSWGLDQGRLRNLGTRLHEAISRVSYSTPAGFRHTAFRVVRKLIVQAMLRHRTRTPVISALLWQTTRRVHNVEVRHDERAHGHSTLRVRHGALIVLHNLFRASTMPLRFLSAFGFACVALAILLGTFFLGRWLVGVQPPPGWTSAFLVTVFFGGATLFGVGLLGEYVGLIMEEVRGRPQWQIRRTIGATSSTQQRTGRSRETPGP